MFSKNPLIKLTVFVQQ